MKRYDGQIKVWLIGILSLLVVRSSAATVSPRQLPRQEGAVSADIREARLYLKEQLSQALENSMMTDELMAYIQKRFPGEPEEYPAIVLAYYGTLRGLQAKFAFNPQKKLAGLTDCLKYLDKAVQKPEVDLEVFFLRFSSFHHLPPLLGIPKRRGEDIDSIISLLVEQDYHVIDKEYQLVMIDFMLQSRRLKPAQQLRLESLKKKLQGPSRQKD